MAGDRGGQTSDRRVDGAAQGRRADGLREVIPDGVLLSRELRAGDGVEVARHRFRPVEVAVPALPSHVVTLHLNGPNRVVQWRDGRAQEWVEHPGEIAIHPAGPPVVTASLAVSEDVNVLLDDRFVRGVAAEAAGDPGRIELADLLRVRDPQLERLLVAFLPELATGGFGGRLYTEALATALTVHLLRHYSSLGRTANAALTREPDRRLPALRQVTEYIEAHLDQSLGLAELAAMTDRSPRHFTRLFRAATGFSPHQYVIRRRVERAKLLLATTDLPLVRIADDVGFADASHLTVHFRRLVGVSPARYRR
jgi:AraC family transcriptional regulator